MTGCNTGRNIQKYKGAGASTLQDALENSDTSFLNVNLVSPGLFIGDGGGLSNISAGSTSGNLQSVTNNGATTSNKITFSNGVTSLETSGNALVTGNVTATEFLGDGGTLSNISANKNFQEVTDLGATSSNKITLTNSGTSLETSGNIELGHASDTTIARSSAGVVTIEGNEIRTGVVPVSKGGTGPTSASAAATALGVGTGNSPQFAGIELGHSSDTTLARSSAGVVTIEGNEIRTGVVPVSKGGTGPTSASAAATALGVGTGNSPQFAGIELGHSSDTTLARSSAGVVTIEGNEIRTGIVPVSKGGTGTTTLNNLITMGTHTTGDFVGTITGGNGIASSAGTTGEDTNHTLSIDEKSNGGLVFESNKLAVNLGASSITGTLNPGDGGTGHSSYTVGQLLVANGGTSFTKLTPGTSGYFLQSQGAGSALKWESASNIGSATPGELIMGNYLTGGPHTGATNTTIHVDGTTANTGSKVVVRDSSGDIRVQEVIVGTGTTGTLTSTAWSGSAAKLTTARNIGGVSFDGTADINLPGVNTTGTQNTSGSAAKLTTARNIGGVSFDGTADITLPGVNTSGTVDTSGKAAKVTITNTDTGNNNRNVLYETGTVNTIGKDAGITYNPSTNILTAGGFAGVGSSLTSLSPGNISGQVPTGKGGTGIAGGYSAGDILYGASSGTALSKLTPNGSNDVGKFFKLGAGNVPEWATVSVSTTTIVTTNEGSSPDDHGLIFVSGAGTGAQSLLKDSNGTSFGTLKYKPSTGTLKTSNIITTDTSGDARNGIANTAPTHTLDIGSNVSIIDDGIDKLVIRGNCYVINDIVSLGTIHTDILQAKDAFIKNTTVVAERPTRQVRLN